MFTAQSAGGATVSDFKLNNGIKVIFAKTNGVEVVSLRVFTPVSVLSENAKNAGISNLTSSLMVKATKNRPSVQLADDVENIGADLSCDTDYDMSSVNMSFLSEYFDRAVEICADVVSNPAFEERDIVFEKQNIKAGLVSRKDSIGRTASDKFIKLFYGDMPYSVPEAGSIETVGKITAEDMENWHGYAYNASNILISVAGNIDEQTVKKSLEKHFGSINSGKKYEKPVFAPAAKKAETKTIKGKFNQAYIMQGYPAPDLTGKDFVALKVIGALLGGRMTSTLFVELREKLGLAYEVNAVYPSRIEESFFAIYIGLDKKNIDLTLKRIDEILKDFCSKEVGAQELKDTKTYIKGLYVMDRQTTGRLSYYYGWREIVGQGYKYDEEYINDIEKITPKDIHETANRVFGKSSLTVIVNPDEK